MVRLTWIGAALLLAMMAGCQSTGRSEVATPALPERDPAAARTHVLVGIDALAAGDLDAAEAAFTAAIEADAFSGVAHNNLGKVYYHQHRLYPAAQQFQYAVRLLPHHPEPRNNLGLVSESAGKLDEAVEEYNRALALSPDNPHLLGNLARARVRRGDDGQDMQELLSQLVMREERQRWLDWAKSQLSRFGMEPSF